MYATRLRTWCTEYFFPQDEDPGLCSNRVSMVDRYPRVHLLGLYNHGHRGVKYILHMSHSTKMNIMYTVAMVTFAPIGSRLPKFCLRLCVSWSTRPILRLRRERHHRSHLQLRPERARVQLPPQCHEGTCCVFISMIYAPMTFVGLCTGCIHVGALEYKCQAALRLPALDRVPLSRRKSCVFIASTILTMSRSLGSCAPAFALTLPDSSRPAPS